MAHDPCQRRGQFLAIVLQLAERLELEGFIDAVEGMQGISAGSIVVIAHGNAGGIVMGNAQFQPQIATNKNNTAELLVVAEIPRDCRD